MLRLTRQANSRISDRLAIFAALLLLVTSLAGFGNSVISSSEGEELLIASSAAESTPVSLQSRNFKVSLFLFRNH